jgi:hypothetical protein
MRLWQWRSGEERGRQLRPEFNRIATFEACSGFTHVKAR